MIRYVQEKLLAFYTKRLIQSNKRIKVNVGYQQAKVMGLLYTQGESENKAIILKFIEQIRDSGKKIQVLSYIPKLTSKNQAIDTSVASFSNQDITYLGKCINQQLADFINTSFDYLYHVDFVSNPVLDYLLAQSKAKCIVGNFDINRANLLEIMVEPIMRPGIPPLDGLMGTILHYTQLL